MKHIKTIEDKIRVYLSHHPRLYALIVGTGIVLFWRGVWHTTDLVHNYFSVLQSNTSLDSVSAPLWDGPLSLFVGGALLLMTGAFTSSFIGNELILSGLRGERRLSEKTETEVETEEEVILEIKTELDKVNSKIIQLEKEFHKKNLK